MFRFLPTIPLVIYGLVTLLVLGCNESSSENDIFCDFEKVEQNENEVYFVANKEYFKTGQLQSDNEAFAGKYSIRLDSINKFGASYFLTGIKTNEYIRIEVLQKKSTNGNGNLVLTSSQDLLIVGDKFISKDTAWVYHYIEYRAVHPIDSLNIFLAHANGDEIYFDNLKISRTNGIPDNNLPEGKVLNLTMSDSLLDLLNQKIVKLQDKEYIEEDDKKNFNAQLKIDKNWVPIKLRLKGDFTDHVKTGFPSFRIKIKGNTYFNGMRSFSIQHPRTRNYQHEFIVHQLLDSLGVLNTTYEFIPVYLNNNYLGVYALEEHFEKQLLESRNHRESPILKFDETGFWKLGQLNEANLSNIQAPYYSSAQIIPFKASKTSKSSVLNGNYENGKLLLEGIVAGHVKPNQVFDINYLARYYAILELSAVLHGHAWHNRRYYVNPINQKLYPIAYDLIPMENPSQMPYFEYMSTLDSLTKKELQLDFVLFNDADFRESYLTQLYRLIDQNFIINYITTAEKVKKAEGLLKDRVPFLEIKPELYLERQNFLLNLKSRLYRLHKKWKTKNIQIERIVYPEELDQYPYFIEEISIIPTVTIVNDTPRFHVKNYHNTAISILGFRLENDSFNKQFIQVKSGQITETSLNSKPTHVFYKVANMPREIYKMKVRELNKLTLQDHPKLSLSENKGPWPLVNKKINIPAGNYQISQTILFPEDVEVIFNSGVTIDLINDAAIICQGRTSIHGTSQNPISLTSSDTTGQGLVILSADTVSIDYLRIENQKALNYNEWVLTGALTIYNSYIIAHNIIVNNSHSEDAINFINSTVKVDSIWIHTTFSDGMDGDFCKGEFEYVKISNAGNDGIDFSGSRVNFNHVWVNGVGDKGVSAGEGSSLSIESVFVYNAKLGLVSKDLSNLNINQAKLDNINLGIALFQKKPEYGPGKLTIQSINYSNVKTPAKIEMGSHLNYLGKDISGWTVNLAKEFY